MKDNKVYICPICGSIYVFPCYVLELTTVWGCLECNRYVMPLATPQQRGLDKTLSAVVYYE